MLAIPKGDCLNFNKLHYDAFRKCKFQALTYLINHVRVLKYGLMS